MNWSLLFVRVQGTGPRDVRSYVRPAASQAGDEARRLRVRTRVRRADHHSRVRARLPLDPRCGAALSGGISGIVGAELAEVVVLSHLELARPRVVRVAGAI